MISKELAKKVRYIQIYTSKAVNDVLAGEYHSVFKGRGMEFDEVREYQPGDEIRTIDWNVTARMGRFYVKQFREERELTIMLLVDMSASGMFGTVNRAKCEVATELCALLAFSAVKNNDKVGLIVFTDSVELFIPPKKGVGHVLRLIRDLLAFSPRRSRTNIGEALDFFGRVVSKRCVAFVVSDFYDEAAPAQAEARTGNGKPAPFPWERAMRIVGGRHDLIAVSVSDPRESEIPNAGLVMIEDLETGEMTEIDTGSAAVRAQYRKLAEERRTRLRRAFALMETDHIEVGTGRDYLSDLLRFFRMRGRRR